MPLYTFECVCGNVEEHLLTMPMRDKTNIFCSDCKELMRRVMDMPVLGKAAYQMQAVLNNGQHVKGHFGKSAKKK